MGSFPVVLRCTKTRPRGDGSGDVVFRRANLFARASKHVFKRGIFPPCVCEVVHVSSHDSLWV